MSDNIELGLDGAWNDRDSASLGGTTAGVLYRTSALMGLSPAGQSQLEAWGVTDVIDLRTPSEVSGSGEDKVPASTTVHLLPIVAGGNLPGMNGAPVDPNDPVVQKMMGTIFGSDNPEQAMQGFMQQVYHDIVTDEKSQQQIAAALKIIAEAQGVSLVHCSAGKDRTGVVVALALLTAGADEAAVYADYQYSERAVASQEAGLSNMVQSVELPAGVLDAALGVDRTYLQAALDAIVAGYGSVEQYLDTIGVDAATRATLNTRLATRVA